MSEWILWIVAAIIASPFIVGSTIGFWPIRWVKKVDRFMSGPSFLNEPREGE